MLTLFSPAKLNLFLRVVGRRSDGYHNICSLFQAIDLGDELSFSISSDGDILEGGGSSFPRGSDNLIMKAVDLFRAKTSSSLHVRIEVVKNIPMEAGLGGGSGNAATALWAMNELSGRPATLSDLCMWAAELGSDVPFFLSKGTALCVGRGETIMELSPHSERGPLWIVKPDYGLSTAKVYGAYDSTTISTYPSQYFNDLEKPAFKLSPELKNLKQLLLDCGFETVVLSGSGTSFFCFGDCQPPSFDGITSYRAKFINRVSGSWYNKRRYPNLD